jgi:hypothetical protein
MFEIEEWAKTRLEDIEVLSQKNRQPDEAPGVKLHLEMTVANHLLTTLDGRLKGWLFERNEAAAPKVTRGKDNVTGTLDGVEPVSDLPNLSSIGKHVKSLKWADEVSGCAAIIRFATTELALDDATCGPFVIKPKEGGTCVLKFPLEAPNASEKVFAKLAKYKSREIELRVKQHAPAQEQQRIDGTKDPKPTETIAEHADKVVALVKAAADKAEGKIPDTPGNTPGFPPSGKAVSAETPPQSATTEVVKTRRTGRRVVAGIE